MLSLPAAMLAHLGAVTTDAQRLRAVWAPDGVLEFPYAPPGMTARIEGVDALVAFFGGSRRWTDWTFEPVRLVSDATSRIHVAEIRGTATTVAAGEPYVQDYLIWMVLDVEGRIDLWREYWDKSRI